VTTQAIVIGLGQFGLALATALTQKGVEVLGVDARAERVRAAAPVLTEVVSFDSTDEEALARTNPPDRDVCVCAIGNEAREASIITTALLRQMGARRVVARATDPLHERILHLVGAHEVVNPEQAFGERYATRLVYATILDEIELGADLVITELKPPSPFVGRDLASLELPRRFGVTVIAMRRADRETAELPDPRRPLGPDDLLVVVARRGAVAQLLQKVS
jgi:trk system potassium uptake protein